MLLSPASMIESLHALCQGIAASALVRGHGFTGQTPAWRRQSESVGSGVYLNPAIGLNRSRGQSGQVWRFIA